MLKERIFQELKVVFKRVQRALVLAVGVVVPSLVAAADTDFEDRVRAYLLANPEVILEALEILSEREARSEMARKIGDYPELFGDAPVLGIGPEDAQIRVVEFFDYRCVPCKVLHPKLVTALEAHPNVRLEMRQLPILSPGSERAARFALAVKAVAGKTAYAAVHDDLWALHGPLRAAAFEEITHHHGLDWVAIDSAMKSKDVSERIAKNRDMAIDLEILGTPAFVTQHSVSFGQSDAPALVAEWLSQ